MNDPFQLVTNCNFKGKDYLVQMCVLNSKKLELIITDKIMAEDWQCEYDSCYIEALTHKTGNFKQFDVFVMMLKSGLLKTSDCITLDLLTLDDLEQLRCKKLVNSNSSTRTNQLANLNKRYLILTYSVEFDRIHYPLPLDYCGPPDPLILQSNIRRLESEVERLKHKNNLLSRNDGGDVKKFKERIQALIEDNKHLTNEVQRLNKIIARRGKPTKSNESLLNCLKKLEKQVFYEKNHNRQIINKLNLENKQLKQQVLDLKRKEKSLTGKLKEGSQYCFQKNCEQSLKNCVSPNNFIEANENLVSRPVSANFLSRPGVRTWKNSSVTKFQDFKNAKNSQNRFLSSSSSDSEKELCKPRSREKKTPVRQNLCSKRIESCRRNSNERSQQSSDDSKRNTQLQNSRRSVASDEGKPESFVKSGKSSTLARSRDSSLSSRGSSKQSRTSRFSNRGSGDYLKGKRNSKKIQNEKDEIQFTMSDLEARIHSLQKLLSEGLHF